MIFEQIPIGGASRNFAYIVGAPETHEAAVVDPAYDLPKILAKLDSHELSVKYIIHTHGHYDHAGGTPEFQAKRGGQVVAFEQADITVAHGDELALGELTLSFLHTPGHTPDSICVLCANKLISGDTLFVGKIGGTSTRAQAETEYASLHEVIMKLPDETEVYPGHDYGNAPSSTIAHERETNPFLLQPDFDAFVHLKENWAAYKKEHGIS